MTFVFLRGDDETAGERMARCAREALADGPMGAYLNRERYVAFLEVWGRADQLSRVRTSCAVFAAAVKGHCGGALTQPWRADGTWGITSWLALRFAKPAWVPWDGVGEPAPPVGAILYWGSKTGSNGHVGVVVERLPSGLYRTAEGGGSPTSADVAAMLAASATQTQVAATNGTVCRLSQAKSVALSAGRRLAGWWDPRHMGIPITSADTQLALHDTEPAPPPSSQPSLPLDEPSGRRVLRLTRPRMTGDDVRDFQRSAGKIAVDGVFGAQSEARAREIQQAHGLLADGVVGPKTWAKLEGRLA